MEIIYGTWRATANPDRKAGQLAPREAQHLLALASGLTTKEIAREFGVSPSTVRHSLDRIYQRLNVVRATAAVAQAMRRGWIAPLLLLLMLLVGAMNPGSDALRIRQPTRTRTQVSASSRIARRDLGSIYA